MLLGNVNGALESAVAAGAANPHNDSGKGYFSHVKGGDTEAQRR